MGRKLTVTVWCIAACCFFLFPAPQWALCREKAIIGWLERVLIEGDKLVLYAKIDTGADTSSLHVTDINLYKKNRKRWVRFKVMNRSGESVLFDRRVKRVARVKSLETDSQRRYYVEMGICLGDVYKIVQVNLVDRSGFNFHMLVGRNFLQDSFIVDPSLEYTREPSCGKDPTP